MKRRAFFNRAAALLLSDFWLGNHILLSSRLRPPFRQGGDSPPKDPWPAGDLVEPKQFAARLQADASKVSILYVGFPVLYRAAHLPGAKLAGPCSKPEGLTALRAVAGPLSRERAVLLYCGCCPFDHCPNIRPGYSAIRELGFSRVSVLHIATNLHTDWISQGYPIEKPAKS